MSVEIVVTLCTTFYWVIDDLEVRIPYKINGLVSKHHSVSQDIKMCKVFA